MSIPVTLLMVMFGGALHWCERTERSMHHVSSCYFTVIAHVIFSSSNFWLVCYLYSHACVFFYGYCESFLASNRLLSMFPEHCRLGTHIRSGPSLGHTVYTLVIVIVLTFESSFFFKKLPHTRPPFWVNIRTSTRFTDSLICEELCSFVFDSVFRVGSGSEID